MYRVILSKPIIVCEPDGVRVSVETYVVVIYSLQDILNMYAPDTVVDLKGVGDHTIIDIDPGTLVIIKI